MKAMKATQVDRLGFMGRGWKRDREIAQIKERDRADRLAYAVTRTILHALEEPERFLADGPWRDELGEYIRLAMIPPDERNGGGKA